ncbi:MAG TPA: hypothetical protein VFA40_10810, partial [Terriglobales bacterium]|nr:hypothetical protein [Terriglobales bacterium]
RETSGETSSTKGTSDSPSRQLDSTGALPRHVRRQQKALAPPVQARWKMRLPTRPGSGEDPPQRTR